MKKVIIVQHGGGELANQLWNFISIYAYCLERGYECRNYSFFEYGSFFDIPVRNRLISLIFFLPLRGFSGRRSAKRVKFLRLLYKLCYAKPITYLRSKQLISSQNTEKKVYYLPPTASSIELAEVEKRSDTLYTTGWLFRNPEGIIKYRTQIVDYFKPNKNIRNSIETTLSALRGSYRNIIGVHIRQGDYAVYKDGEYLVPQERIRKILDEYLAESAISKTETFFLITSDGRIDTTLFQDLNFSVSKKSPVEDMMTLAQCDAILGSNSSFGNFAAYYGNVPHIVFEKDAMDWIYYRGKSAYFQNKYCTLVQY